jgi:ankyrin repeat protein
MQCCYDQQEGWSPLHAAAEEGHVGTVIFLLNNGADLAAVTKGTHSKWTPLHLAAKKGHLEIVNIFLNRGANVNVKGPVSSSMIR